MLQYIELATHVMVGYGIDGFALDIEGDIYEVLQKSATARASWIEFLVKLKARMQQAVPGSQLSVWCTTTGGPWNALFTPQQAAAAVASVDYFLIMGCVSPLPILLCTGSS